VAAAWPTLSQLDDWLIVGQVLRSIERWESPDGFTFVARHITDQLGPVQGMLSVSIST
jgi:hypothetical protein